MAEKKEEKTTKLDTQDKGPRASRLRIIGDVPKHIESHKYEGKRRKPDGK